MNMTKINQLLAWLDAGAPEFVATNPSMKDLPPVVGFNMRAIYAHIIDDATAKNWHLPKCGTACCIAGFVLATETKADKGEMFRVAGELLGLSYEVADALFLGYDYNAETKRTGQSYDLGEITASQAAATIRHLIETGNVRWQI
jgi:hypothetical protein